MVKIANVTEMTRKIWTEKMLVVFIIEKLLVT